MLLRTSHGASCAPEYFPVPWFLVPDPCAAAERSEESSCLS
jgi:hypothetical protein